MATFPDLLGTETTSGRTVPDPKAWGAGLRACRRSVGRPLQRVTHDAPDLLLLDEEAVVAVVGGDVFARRGRQGRVQLVGEPRRVEPVGVHGDDRAVRGDPGERRLQPPAV